MFMDTIFINQFIKTGWDLVATAHNKALPFVVAICGQAFEEATTHPPST
jgi:hypothetical protein